MRAIHANLLTVFSCAIACVVSLPMPSAHAALLTDITSRPVRTVVDTVTGVTDVVAPQQTAPVTDTVNDTISNPTRQSTNRTTPSASSSTTASPSASSQPAATSTAAQTTAPAGQPTQQAASRAADTSVTDTSRTVYATNRLSADTANLLYKVAAAVSLAGFVAYAIAALVTRPRAPKPVRQARLVLKTKGTN